MADELTCARRTRKVVEENGDQILLRKENKKNKKRKMAFELLSCTRRIRKTLTNLKMKRRSSHRLDGL